MGFPWILQRYIFRELRNNFILAAIALTGILSLGGGVLQMMKLGEVTPAQFARLMVLVVPVAAALTLPIAALFATAVSYGRISADNEFVACRSSGINLHSLLLPTVLLSLVTATITFAFANYLIPQLIRNLNEFLTSDFGSLIEQRLKMRRGIVLGGRYRIHADEFELDRDNPGRIGLHRVAFVEENEGEWVRYGTARDVRLSLERDERVFRASGQMSSLTFYDRRDGRFLDSQDQLIPESEIAPALKPQIKFLTLGELMYYFRHPEEWADVRDAFTRLRAAAGQSALINNYMNEWQSSRRITLGTDDWRVVIRPESVERSPRGALEFAKPNIEETRKGARKTTQAEGGSLQLSALPEGGVAALIELINARPAKAPAAETIARATVGPFPIASAFPPGQEPSIDALLAAPAADALGDEVATKRRAEAQRILGETRRHVLGTIHERLAFSLSVFALVLLAASLGIVFRGAHVLTAFGISFLPMVFVLVMILTGRQMARNEPTHLLGLGFIWGGIVAVGLLDTWILARVLRR